MRNKFSFIKGIIKKVALALNGAFIEVERCKCF